MSLLLETPPEVNLEREEDRDPSVTFVKDRDIIPRLVGIKILPNVPKIGGRRELPTKTAVETRLTLMRLSHTRSVSHLRMR